MSLYVNATVETFVAMPTVESCLFHVYHCSMLGQIALPRELLEAHFATPWLELVVYRLHVLAQG